MMEFSRDLILVTAAALVGGYFGAHLPWERVFQWLGFLTKTYENSDANKGPDPFILESARLIGQVCQIDSPVSPEERKAFHDMFFTLFSEATKDRTELITAFESENLRGRNLAEGIAQFYWDYSSRKEQLRALLLLSIKICIVDGAKNASEEHILEVIARTFGIHSKDYWKMEREVLESYYEQMGYTSSKKVQHGGPSSHEASHTEEQSRARKKRSEKTLTALSHSKYFRALGLTPNASQQQIKTAYRTLVKENHPDLAGGRAADGGRRFREIQIAYEALQKARRV